MASSSNDVVFFTGLDCTGTALLGAQTVLSNTPPPNPRSAIHASNGQGYRVTGTPPQDRTVESRIFNFGGQCEVFPVATAFTLELEPVNTPPALRARSPCRLIPDRRWLPAVWSSGVWFS